MKYKYKGLFKLLLIVSILSVNFTCYAETTNKENNTENKNNGQIVDKNHDNIPDDQQENVDVCDDTCLSTRYKVSVVKDANAKKFYISAAKGKFTMYVIRKSIYFINGQEKYIFSMQPIIMDFDNNPGNKVVNFYLTEASKQHDLEILLILASDVPHYDPKFSQSELLQKYNAMLGGKNGMDIIQSQIGEDFNKIYKSTYLFCTYALIYAPSNTTYTKNDKLAGLCNAFVNGVSWNAFPNYNDIKNKESFHKLYEQYKPNGSAADTNFFRSVIPYCYESNSKLDVNLDTLYQMMLAALNMKKAIIGNSITLPPINPNDYDKVFDLTDKSDGPDVVGSDGLKCDYSLNTFKNNKNLFDEYLKNPKKYPYVNSNKFYASKVTRTPYQLKHSKKNLSCERTCSEKLTVSYGAPIASKAGVCFEYKVKVHSKVECSSKFTGEVPKPADYPLCEPTPACWHAAGNWVGTGGGPNDKFDMCITKCDGGKYTKKCSQYCYDNIYGGKDTANKKFLDVAVNYDGGAGDCNNAQGKKLPNGTGYYYWDKNNNITWSRGEGSNHWDTYSRFYFLNGRGSGTVYNDYRCGYRSGGGAPFIPSTGGFKLIFINGWICDASCTYVGCEPGDDLNQNDVLDKLYLDLKDFNTQVDQCTAATTCAEKTAEFTMTINYDTKNKSKDKLTYPFNYSDNKFTPSIDQLSTWRDKSDKNTSLGESSTIRSYDYCYYKDSHKEDEYEIEWSFGGTWMHRKTGNISYKKPSSSKEYYLLKGKYCLPKNVKHVNSKWWTMYDNYKTATNNDKTYTPTNGELNAIRNELNGNSSNSDGYNINGKMRNFGYFGWDLDVNCFYALPDPKCPTCCPEGKCDPPAHSDNFIIRPVSEKNLFPNDDREIGYNWRLDDAVVEGFNKVMYGDKYDIERSDILIEAISNNNQINDANLDYKFVLSPADLRKIKKDEKVFGDWVHAGGLFNSYGKPDSAGRIREPQVVYYTSDLVTELVSNKGGKRAEHGNKKLGGDN